MLRALPARPRKVPAPLCLLRRKSNLGSLRAFQEDGWIPVLKCVQHAFDHGDSVLPIAAVDTVIAIIGLAALQRGERD